MTGIRIFEKHPTADAYRIGGAFTPYAVVAKDKRFTDAELAAEYWRARARLERLAFDELSSGDEYGDEAWTLIAHPANTFLRFATLPHYDEQETP